MIRINLLPHRAEKRRARQIQFAALCVISVVLGALLVGFVHGYFSNRISYQERRNEYLKQETAKLDKQIAEIKKLREETQSLLERKNVVENLQSTRSDVVHLLDQMLRILPEGVYLKTLKQTGNKIDISGYAQTNARISTLMRAIDSSPWLSSPSLGVIQASSAGGARVSEFTLTFKLLSQNKDAAAGTTAKPAGTKG
jgi:type IV pilus assembly protein PilN